MAWLARRDGSVVVGRGPFQRSGTAPGDGVAFYKRDFAGISKEPWFLPRASEVMGVDEFRRRMGGGGRGVDLQVRWDLPEAIPFSQVFQEVMECIRRGALEKTVPVVTETGWVEGNPGERLVRAMGGMAAPLYSYGWVEDGAGFAGATPELLFALDGRKLETMALAGTARREDEAVFEVDEKEIREHEYVARTLVAKLRELGRVERAERRVLGLGSIVHFFTGIRVELDVDGEPEELLRELHPTPALGPLPRTEETMDDLCNWRERLGCPAEFGAPFGVREDGKFEAVVAIRGIWWKGGRVSLPAGCGIIEESRLVNEWRELRLKREAVKGF